MKRMLISIMYLAIILTIFQFAIAEANNLITYYTVVQRSDALNKSLKMHFILNHEIKQIIKNTDLNKKTKIKRIADLYQVVSEYISFEMSHTPSDDSYKKKLNVLIEKFNNKFRNHQEASIAENVYLSTGYVDEVNKSSYDSKSYEIQYNQSKNKQEETKYNKVFIGENIDNDYISIFHVNTAFPEEPASLGSCQGFDNEKDSYSLMIKNSTKKNIKAKTILNTCNKLFTLQPLVLLANKTTILGVDNDCHYIQSIKINDILFDNFKKKSKVCVYIPSDSETSGCVSFADCEGKILIELKQ